MGSTGLSIGERELKSSRDLVLRFEATATGQLRLPVVRLKESLI